MSFNKETLALYLIADGSSANLIEKTAAALRGGASFVQLRMKEASSREFYQVASDMAKMCRLFKVPFVINDRVDVALAVNADGVHLGQSDLPAAIARKLLGPDKIIGITAATLETVNQAYLDGADYVGAGALYPTGTKEDVKLLSFEEFKEICIKSPVPVVGIGGISAATTADVMELGAQGICAASAILSAPDSEKVAKSLIGIITKSRY